MLTILISGLIANCGVIAILLFVAFKDLHHGKKIELRVGFLDLCWSVRICKELVQVITTPLFWVLIAMKG